VASRSGLLVRPVAVIPPARENITPVNLFAALLLLVPFLLAALYFVGNALERYGYSGEDIKRLPEIIEKTHGRPYLPKEVFNIVGDALVFWGLFSSALMMTGDPVRRSSQRNCDVC